MKMQIMHENTMIGDAHYSAALRTDNTLYISGQLPLNPVTREKCQGGAKEQVIQALTNIEKLILQENGAGRTDIVKTTAYVADIKYWEEINQGYKEFFGNYRPARSIVAVSAIHFGFLVEIEAVAVLSKNKLPEK